MASVEFGSRSGRTNTSIFQTVGQPSLSTKRQVSRGAEPQETERAHSGFRDGALFSAAGAKSIDAADRGSLGRAGRGKCAAAAIDVGLTVNGSPARRSQVRRCRRLAPLDATNGATGGRRLQAA